MVAHAGTFQDMAEYVNARSASFSQSTFFICICADLTVHHSAKLFLKYNIR